MDFTENLKLTQFTDNDVTSWLGNYNNDMVKIDTGFGTLNTTTSVSSAEIKILQDKVATLETTSTQHTDQLSVNTSSIAANALEIQTLETRENTHYNSLTEQIDALAESGEDNLDKIKVLQSNVQTIRDIAAVNTASISKMEVRIDALESGTQDFEETTQQTLEDHTNRITELESGLTDTDARARKATIDAEHAVTTASVASAQVTMLNLALENVEGDLDNAKTEIASVKETAKTNAANIVTLNASVANNTASISANQMEIASLDTRVESLEDGGNASELTQRVDALETWKTSASTDITTAQTTADGAKTVAENVQSQVSGIKSGAAVPFSLGVDNQGNYGYIKVGADTVTPFNPLKEFQTIAGAPEDRLTISSLYRNQYTYNTRLIVITSTHYRPIYINNRNEITDMTELSINSGIEGEAYTYVELLANSLGLRAYVSNKNVGNTLIVRRGETDDAKFVPISGLILIYLEETQELII